MSTINLKIITALGLLVLLFAGITAVFLDRNYGPQPLLRFQGKSSVEMAARVDFDFGDGWDRDARVRMCIEESSVSRGYSVALPARHVRKMKINFDAIEGDFELKGFEVSLDKRESDFSAVSRIKSVSESSCYRFENGSVVAQGRADEKLPSLRIYLPENADAWPRPGGTPLFWKRFGSSFLAGFLVLGAVLVVEPGGGKIHE